MPEKSAENTTTPLLYGWLGLTCDETAIAEQDWKSLQELTKAIQRNAKHAAMLEAAEMVIKTGWRYEKLHARILEAAKKYED